MRRSSVSLLVALSLGAALVGACAGGGSSSTSNHPNKPLVIGLVDDFSGVEGFYGPESKNVAQLAIDDINKAGGLSGRPVKLVIGDAASNPQQELSEG